MIQVALKTIWPEDFSFALAVARTPRGDITLRCPGCLEITKTVVLETKTSARCPRCNIFLHLPFDAHEQLEKHTNG